MPFYGSSLDFRKKYCCKQKNLLFNSWEVHLERKRCTYDRENDDLNTTTPSMLKLPFDSKGYGVKRILRSAF